MPRGADAVLPAEFVEAEHALPSMRSLPCHPERM
jgi:hypothetical protein